MVVFYWLQILLLSRIVTMKTIIIFISCFLLTAPAAFAQYAPQIEFESVPNFFKLPEGMNFGEVSAVAANSQGHVFVFHRANPSGGGPAYGIHAAQLFEFDARGRYQREIGRKTESVSEAAQPFEHVDTPRPHQDGLFREPTDVAFDSAGNIFITDGYINSRVAKYDANGDWEKSWGEPGTGPGQFRLPHSIAIDKDDNLYVGDRSNARVQVFDTNGNYLREFSVATPVRPGSKAVNGSTPVDLTEISANGAPNALCIPPGSDVIFVGETTFPGRIIKATLQGEVLGVIGNSGRNLGEFSGAHGIACPTENLLYVAETSNYRAQKLILK